MGEVAKSKRFLAFGVFTGISVYGVPGLGGGAIKQISEQDGDSAVTYKVTVSIIFGLIGFAVNFYPIDFVFYGSYRISFLIGLVFPMLITLAWGWRYGLLSALAGGCQTMWMLWMPGSGYGSFVSVPPFTLWIIWIGWFARTSYSNRYGIYAGEIIFRIFNTVLIYTVVRWAFTLNVPPANTFMPFAVAHSIVFKEAVNGLFILFLAQAMLHSEPVRMFFRLPEGEADPRYDYIYTNAVILGCTVALFFAGEWYVWGSWAPEFQNAARVLGALSLFMAWLLCTYAAADIFARKRSEEIIRAEAAMHYGEYLGAIIETSHDGIYVLDAGGHFEFGNDAAFETFGWQRGDLVGQTFMKVIHPDFNRFAFQRWGEVQRGEGVPYEVDIVRKDGTVRSLLISHTDVDIGGTRKYCAVMKDITERKRAEKELERYRDRLEELVAERTTELRKANRELKREIAERKRAEAYIKHLNSVLKAIRNVNQLIVVEKDKSVMLQKACDILVEARGYDVAWAGLPVGTDDSIESTESTPARFTGFVSSSLAGDIPRFREAVTCGNHPPCFGDLFAREQTGAVAETWVGAGARSGTETEMVRVIDRPYDCGDCLLKDACPGNATAITRIEHAGVLLGLLGISFASDIILDDEEKGLLQEVAGDIAFALHGMRIEEARNVAENALAESEEKYRLLADNSIECIWQMNQDFELTYVNPAVLRMFGFTQDEWIGSLLPEHCSPESLEFMSGLIRTELAKGRGSTRVTFETQLIHKNGEAVPVEITGRALFDEDRGLTVFQGSTRDITERKRAETHIEHLNSVLKAIRNVNQLIVVEKDKSVMLQKACDILIEARGYDVAWVGLPVGTDDSIESTESTGFVSGFTGDISRFREAVTCGNHPPCFGDLFARERTGAGAGTWVGAGARSGTETEMVRVIDRPYDCGDCRLKDACPGNATAITRIEHAGVLFGLLGISFASGTTLDDEEKGLLQEVAGDMAFALHDMRIEEERKVAEKALAEREEKYRLLADNSIECIWQMNPDLRFTYVNPSVLRMVGFTPDEWIGSSLSEHCSPESLGFMSGLMSAALAKGQEVTSVTFETQLFHKNGETVPVEITSRMLFDEDGNPTVFQGSTRDITERKTAEAKLAQTLADLKRSNAELAQFAHAASHDLQEPLRMISSYVQLLSQRYKGRLDSDADEFIGFAVDGAKQMHRLIDDLLTLSRVGTRGDGFAEIHSDEALEMSLADLQESIKTNGAVVTYDPLPVVVASASQLTLLFKNLIENAIKFQSKDSPRIRISAAQKGDEWEFSVADNGIGIEPQYFDRIFKVFQQLHPASEYPGTGIGLALARKIVERHGGRIWVESEQGKGTTFYFTIPTRFFHKKSSKNCPSGGADDIRFNSWEGDVE